MLAVARRIRRIFRGPKSTDSVSGVPAAIAGITPAKRMLLGLMLISSHAHATIIDGWFSGTIVTDTFNVPGVAATSGNLTVGLPVSGHFSVDTSKSPTPSVNTAFSLIQSDFITGAAELSLDVAGKHFASIPNVTIQVRYPNSRFVALGSPASAFTLFSSCSGCPASVTGLSGLSVSLSSSAMPPAPILVTAPTLSMPTDASQFDLAAPTLAGSGTLIYTGIDTQVHAAQFSIDPGSIRIIDRNSIVPPTTMSAPIAPQFSLPYGISAGTPGILPPATKNLVIVTHGWNGSGVDPWIASMVTNICGKLGASDTHVDATGLWPIWTCTAPGWVVSSADWSEQASQVGPGPAYASAATLGDSLGDAISTLGLQYVHLIAHSAGSNLIQHAARRIVERCAGIGATYCSGTDVYTTFLDAYAPLREAQDYGQASIYAEHYVDTLPVGLFSIADPTNVMLPYAFNFDITAIDPYSHALVLNPLDATSISEQRHAWPYEFYNGSVPPPVVAPVNVSAGMLQPFRYGFPKSLEGGADTLTNRASYPALNCSCPISDAQNTICEVGAANSQAHCPLPSFLQLLPDFISTIQTAVSPTGTVAALGPIGSGAPMPTVRLTTGSPAWTSIQFQTATATDAIEFNYTFGGSAAGLLSVFLDDELIFSAEETHAYAGTNTSRPLPFKVDPGVPHVLTLRLDPTSAATSTVDLSNFRISSLVLSTVSNRPPVANAGVDRKIEATSPSGVLVSLDGRLSTDPDYDALTYAWSGAFGGVSGAMASVTLPIGDNVVTLTVDDGHGGSASASATITVVDTTPPVIVCPVNVVGTVGLPVALGAATATDLVTTSPAITNDAPGSFVAGVTTVTWTARDAAGNAAKCAQTVTMQISIPLVLGQAQPTAMSALTSTGLTIGTITTQVASNVPVGSVISESPPAGTIVASGAAVNLVVAAADTIAPAITCPKDVTVTLGVPISLGIAIATDNVTTSPTITNNAPSSFPVGTTTVLWTATDGAGNKSSCNQTVAVTYPYWGFLLSVRNPPYLNALSVNDSVALKFSLFGNRGLGILASGSPQVSPIACPSGPSNTARDIDTRRRGLYYNSLTSIYSYVWQPTKTMQGTCQQFTMTLNDGTQHQLLFRITK